MKKHATKLRQWFLAVTLSLFSTFSGVGQNSPPSKDSLPSLGPTTLSTDTSKTVFTDEARVEKLKKARQYIQEYKDLVNNDPGFKNRVDTGIKEISRGRPPPTIAGESAAFRHTLSYSESHRLPLNSLKPSTLAGAGEVQLHPYGPWEGGGTKFTPQKQAYDRYWPNGDQSLRYEYYRLQPHEKTPGVLIGRPLQFDNQKRLDVRDIIAVPTSNSSSKVELIIKVGEKPISLGVFNSSVLWSSLLFSSDDSPLAAAVIYKMPSERFSTQFEVERELFHPAVDEKRDPELARALRQLDLLPPMTRKCLRELYYSYRSIPLTKRLLFEPEEKIDYTSRLHDLRQILFLTSSRNVVYDLDWEVLDVRSFKVSEDLSKLRFIFRPGETNVTEGTDFETKLTFTDKWFDGQVKALASQLLGESNIALADQWVTGTRVFRTALGGGFGDKFDMASLLVLASDLQEGVERPK